MATLPTQTVTRGGLGPSMANAAPGGDKCAPGKHTALYVVNDDDSPINVTVITPNTVDGLAVADLVVPVPAGQFRFIGNLDPELFAGPDGLVSWTYSATDAITVAVVKVV